MNQQFSLFEIERVNQPRGMPFLPDAYYRATDELVVQEAYELYRQHAHHYTRFGEILRDLAERHRLGGFWTATIDCLCDRGLLDEMNCYYGSDTPVDKSRKYLGYSIHYRLKKGATWR